MMIAIPSIHRPIIGAVILSLGLSACGTPFVDSRREAGSTGTVGASSANRPVICYAKGETTPDQIRAMAAEVCAETGRFAVFEREDLGNCRLMQPWRAFFRCEKPGTTWTGYVSSSPLGSEHTGAGSLPSAWGDWHGAVYPQGGLPQPPRL
ncbi:hypothetical protein [Rhodospira trueperi]|uniref:Lipoprotein n=1 Tax=Rhodospira trueperi TaxID=69960 RepID=A0A1G6X0K1_9PROT|nr:hypothetical protein [Rhodospira trueperi]SDD70765.1 hypothetical protein SAMN05421720_101309 [Rhodospira trueperi]